MKRNLIPMSSRFEISEDLFTLVKDSISLKPRESPLFNEKDLENQLEDAMVRYRSVNNLAVNDPRYIRELNEVLTLNGKFYEFLVCKVTGVNLGEEFFAKQ
jgi:hypothetical protein